MSIKNTKVALVNLTRRILADHLSTIPSGNGTTKPAVILNRAGSDKPSFPYGVVDFINSKALGYSSTNSYYEEDGMVDEYHSVATFMLQVNGGINDDTISLISLLRNTLLSEKGLRIFNEVLPDAGLVSVSSPTFFPSFMKTDYEEAARVLVEISMSNIIQDTATTTIDSIDLDGEIYNNFSQEDAPISINITAP